MARKQKYNHHPVVYNGLGCAFIAYLWAVMFKGFADQYFIGILSFVGLMLITNTILWGVYKKL